jgi:hypothetical protein
MSITVVARSAAALCVALVCAVAAIAQIPTVPSAPAFQVAEVRGLEDAPASAESGFESGSTGPRFAGTTRAVVARFVASPPPAEPRYTLTWIKGNKKEAPRVLAREEYGGDALASGITSMLAGGEPLAPGDYQVLVTGASGRVYRALEFVVRPLPRRPNTAASRPAPEAVAPETAPPSESLAPAAALAAHTVGSITVDYPTTYSVLSMRDRSETGSVFVNGYGTGFLFVAARDAGRFSFQREADDLRQSLQRSSQNIRGITGWRGVTAKRAELPPRAKAGRLFLASSDEASFRVVMYLYEIDGESVIAGYGVASPRKASDTPALDPERTIGDFLVLSQSLRRASAEPAADERPDERAPVDRREIAVRAP